MELVTKCAAMCFLCCIAALLIKKTSPELALCLSAATVVLILIAAADYLSALSDLSDAVRRYSNADATLTKPVLKCVAIAIVTRIASDLCKDSSQGAAGGAIELVGTISALCVTSPLIIEILKLIGSMI